MGWLGYELGRHLERVPPPAARPRPARDGAAAVRRGRGDRQRRPPRLDRVERAARRPIRARPGRPCRAPGWTTPRGVSPARAALGPPPVPAAAPPITSNFTRAAYEAAVRRVVDLHPGRGHLPGEPVAALPGRPPGRADAVGPVPAAAARATRRRSRPTWSSATSSVVSASPERFLRAATAAAGRDPADQGHAAARAPPPSEDERAGRGAAGEREGPGRERDDRRPAAQRPVARLPRRAASRVPELCALESFATVHPPGLDRRGRAARRGWTRSTCCAACFPGGSITGAPKIRAMEIIAELEPVRARPLLRRDRLAGRRRRAGHQHRHPHAIAIRGRRGDVPAPAAGSWPTPTRRPSTRRRWQGRGRWHRRRSRRDGCDPPDRQLRLVRPQPGPLRPRAGAADARSWPQRRGHAWTTSPRSRRRTSSSRPGPCTPDRGRRLAGAHPRARRPRADPRRLPGPPVHRRGLRRAGGARAAGRCTARPRRSATTGSGVFAGLPDPLQATRYHSLVVIARGPARTSCVVTARSEEGEIMALRHRSHPVVGVQFHPEAVLTEHGHDLLAGVPGGRPAPPAASLLMYANRGSAGVPVNGPVLVARPPAAPPGRCLRAAPGRCR